LDVPGDRHPAARVFLHQAARADLYRGDQVCRRPDAQADLGDQAGQLLADQVVLHQAGQVFRHLDGRAAKCPEAERLDAVADASSAVVDAMMVD
jgi:hypothetical protein